MICDSQVHAPDTPPAGRVRGISHDALRREMAAAGVDRVMIVPLAAPGELVDNEPALLMAEREPERFRVMGLLALLDRDATERSLRTWRDRPALLGARVPFVREPYRSLLAEERLEWLWAAAEAAGVPIMLNAPGLLAKVAAIARDHPRLRIAIDHFGIEPYRTYGAHELLAAVRDTVGLARHANVSVKASALPCAVAESFPFPSLHEPIRRVLEAFGPRRVFWGSDLTRLACTYREAVILFSERLPFLTGEDREWVMGRGLCAWSGWLAGSTSQGSAR